MNAVDGFVGIVLLMARFSCPFGAGSIPWGMHSFLPPNSWRECRSYWNAFFWSSINTCVDARCDSSRQMESAPFCPVSSLAGEKRQELNNITVLFHFTLGRLPA